MTTDLVSLAAQAGTGGQLLGSITVSGLTLAAGSTLVLAIRGSGPVPHKKVPIAINGLTFGTLATAAGGTWADIVNGIHTVPDSGLNSGAIDNPGAGGVALFLALITFGPNWKKLIVPALLSIALAASCGVAGGYWSIASDLVRNTVIRVAGAA